ncbi:hypothetical protein L1987_30112 [Smallanthus sonchifolius]|uniref:Uncharacterized protein n=1 Tax=Smallanthus sonchifolius TaxID=185202 RepID=A0ACB9I2J7_9ASTR|nr:hypothetical protein L1987_30112 [Smallanthus sonchifolius]
MKTSFVSDDDESIYKLIRFTYSWSHPDKDTEEFTQNAMDFEKDMQSCKQSADDLKNVWNDRSGLQAQKQCTSIWFWALQG